MMKTILFILAVFMSVRVMAVDTVAADSAYTKGDYASAIKIYEGALNTGVESAELYYNLGNCYYKSNVVGKAILNYERCLLLKPNFSEAKYNLKMAQNGIVDKLSVIPELFFVRWYKNLRSHFSADQWSYISISLFVVFLLSLTFFFYSKVGGVRKLCFFVGILTLILSIWTLSFASVQNERVAIRNYGVIMSQSVTVKGSPNDTGTDLFLIHEGMKVQISDEVGEWANIKLVDGNEGWVMKKDFEKI